MPMDVDVTSWPGGVPDANGLDVDVTRLPAGEAHIGQVGGHGVSITPALAVGATPDYSIGDNIGGILTLPDAMRTSGGSGVLQSVFLADRANQKFGIDILLFNAMPTDTYTDNSAMPTLSTTDVAKIVRKVSIAAADWLTLGGCAFADISAIGKVVKAVGSANLYAVLVAQGAFNFAATTDLTARFGFLQD